MSKTLRDWIEHQSTRLRQPDINLLIDLFLTSPSDQEVQELSYGLLGESPPIKQFLNELLQKRQESGISPKPLQLQTPNSSSPNKQRQQQLQQQVITGNTGLVGKTTLLTPTPLQEVHSIHSYSQPVVLSHSKPAQVACNNNILSSTQRSTKGPKGLEEKKGGGKNDNNNVGIKTKINPNLSFVNATGDNNNHSSTLGSSNVVLPKKQSLSLNSGVFFTEDDAGVLDISHLMHQDKKAQQKKEQFDKSAMSKTTTENHTFPSLGSKSMTKNKKNPSMDDGFNFDGDTQDEVDDIATELGLNFTARFQVQDKRKKNTNTITSNDNNNNAINNNNIDICDDTTPDDTKQEPLNPHKDLTFFPSRNALRTKCDCMARKHRFYGNCHDCGRIFCLLEGEGDCFYCGSYFINLDINKELVEIAHKINYQNEKDSKSSSKSSKTHSSKTSSIQITSHTRKTLNSTPTDSIQADHELVEMLLRGNSNFSKELNTQGSGIICVPNEIFFEKMDVWIDNARGYYFRTKNRDLDGVLSHKQTNNMNMNSNITNPNNTERVSSIAIRSESAYGANNVDSSQMTDQERVGAGLAKALAFRNTLLQREKEKAQRTKVIDEQNDYYDFESNIWLDKEEKAKKIQIAQQVEDLIESRNEMRTLSIEIDEKTGKVKQSFNKTDYQFQCKGAVGGAVQDIVNEATQLVEKENTKNICTPDVEIKNVYHTGPKYSAKRKEFFQIKARRVDIEKQREETEQMGAKKKDEEGEKKKSISSSRGKDLPSKSTLADDSSRHLSGRALLVFNALRDTLRPNQQELDNDNTPDPITSSWSCRLSQLQDDNDAEYDFYIKNPELYITQGFTPLYNDGEMGNGSVVENATDSGCG